MTYDPSATLLDRAEHFSDMAGDMTNVMHAVMHGADIEARKPHTGMTPLHYAALGGSAALTTYLIAQRAKVNARCYQNKTPLHYAVTGQGPLQERIAIIEALLAAGALLEARDGFGKTPLIHAATNECGQALHTLLAHNADLCAKDCYRRTVLHMAILSGNAQTAQTLIEAGALITDTTCQGQTPLHLAAQGAMAGTVRLLLARGADLALCDHDNKTPLRLAIDAICCDRASIEETVDALKHPAAEAQSLYRRTQKARGLLESFGAPPEEFLRTTPPGGRNL